MDRPRRPDRRRRWRLARSGLGAAQGNSARVGRITAAWRPGPTTRGFIQKEQPAPTLPKMSRAGNALSAPDAFRARKENPESSASASKTGLDATTAGKRRLNPAGPKVFNRFGNGSKRHGVSTRIAGEQKRNSEFRSQNPECGYRPSLASRSAVMRGRVSGLFKTLRIP